MATERSLPVMRCLGLRERSAPGIRSQYPINSSNGVLSSISGLIHTPITAELYKVNSYSPGVCSKSVKMPHAKRTTSARLSSFCTATSREASLFSGTLGGSRPSTGEERTIALGFFYADIKHEILPVKTGYLSHRLIPYFRGP